MMYEIYKNEIIECLFCGKSHNLHYIDQHMKSKNCQSFQRTYIKLHKKAEYNKKMFDHKLNINRLRSSLKLEDYTDDDLS